MDARKIKSSGNKFLDALIEKYRVYNAILNSFHGSHPKEVSRGRKLLNLFFKLPMIAIGSLSTTLAFDFLLKPNGIYNSGINGLLQAIFKYFSGEHDIVRTNYTLFVFGTSLVISSLIIFFLLLFSQAELDVVSTAFFYSAFQLFWSWTFNELQLKKYLFSSFVPENWNSWISQKQIGLTLPFYIAIAVGAALIHTFGYSLIFRAKATPGGLEIVTSHFAGKKNATFSMSYFFKCFGFVIIFLITMIGFFGIDNNIKVKKSELKTYLLEVNRELPLKERFIEEKSDLDSVLNRWKQEKIKVRKLRKSSKEETIAKLRTQFGGSLNVEAIHDSSTYDLFLNNKEDKNWLEAEAIEKRNHQLTNALRSKLASEHFDEYPEEELEFYLMEGSELKQILERKIRNLNNTENKKKYLEHLRVKLDRVNKEYCEKSFFGYLKYISNNERFWATIVYILCSSWLINQMFPRDVRVVLNIQTTDRDKLSEILRILKGFRKLYSCSWVYESEEKSEKEIFVVSCSLSKWRYYLLQEDLKRLNTDKEWKGRDKINITLLETV